jgi:hypothetical protein
MGARRWATGAAIVLALVWGGAGYLVTKPTSFHDYRITAVNAAQSTYNALATARLTATARLDRRVTGPFLDAVLGDCRDALAGAAKRFTGQSPPDQRTGVMRDELGPLLVQASAALDGVEKAAGDRDDGALRAAVDPVAAVAERVDVFIEAHK